VVVLVNNERMAVVPVVGVVNIQKAVMKYKHTYSPHLPNVYPLYCSALFNRLSLNSSIVSHTTAHLRFYHLSHTYHTIQLVYHSVSPS
jgi:hypothetical protein